MCATPRRAARPEQSTRTPAHDQHTHGRATPILEHDQPKTNGPDASESVQLLVSLTLTLSFSSLRNISGSSVIGLRLSTRVQKVSAGRRRRRPAWLRRGRQLIRRWHDRVALDSPLKRAPANIGGAELAAAALRSSLGRRRRLLVSQVYRCRLLIEPGALLPVDGEAQAHADGAAALKEHTLRAMELAVHLAQLTHGRAMDGGGGGVSSSSVAAAVSSPLARHCPALVALAAKCLPSPTSLHIVLTLLAVRSLHSLSLIVHDVGARVAAQPAHDPIPQVVRAQRPASHAAPHDAELLLLKRHRDATRRIERAPEIIAGHGANHGRCRNVWCAPRPRVVKALKVCGEQRS